MARCEQPDCANPDVEHAKLTTSKVNHIKSCKACYCRQWRNEKAATAVAKQMGPPLAVPEEPEPIVHVAEAVEAPTQIAEALVAKPDPNAMIHCPQKELKHKRAAAKRRHEASAITRQSVKEHFDSLGRVLVNMQPPVAQMIDGEIEMLPGPCCKCMKQETTAYRRKHMCERKDNTISCVWQSF